MISALLRRWLLLAPILVLPVVAGVAAGEQAAPQSPPGSVAGLGDLGVLDGLPGVGNAAVENPVSVEGHFTVDPGRSGTLSVTAIIDADYHIFSVTQPPGGPQRTEIRLDPGTGVQLAGGFTAVPPPQKHVDTKVWVGLTIEEHTEQVTWTAPIELGPNASPDSLELTGIVDCQACDPNACTPLKLPFQARLIAAKRPVTTFSGPTSEGEYQKRGSHVKLRGQLGPATARPGGTVELSITAMPAAEWHVYARADRDPNELGSKPTLLVIQSAGGLTHYKAATDALVVVDDQSELGLPPVRYHEGEVTWHVRLDVPDDAEPGPRTVAGIVGFQACATSCETPQAARFQVTVDVSDEGDGDTSAGNIRPLTFAPAKYAQAAKLAADMPIPPLPPDTSPLADTVSELDGYSLWAILGFGLLGGLILNLMPCVLPVIGLKVMSFAHQGGQSRMHVLGLNLTYSGGLLLVFVLLGTLASLAHLGLSNENYGWGELYTLAWFKIGMACLVFAMALSFLGVWELPIPGFAATGTATDLSAHEGYAGAFFKGIFTTILATPCSGPFLGPVFGYTLTQPPYVTYLIFTSVGLGMALPYILIGLFPVLVGWLPKPGAWMETFKQLMAFLLLGTVVFLLSTINVKHVIPTLSLLVAIWFACWWIGRTPITASADKKAFAWLGGTAISVAIGWLGFGTHGVELPWQPWSPQALAEARAEGKAVLVDFTADWCWNCKLNLKRALNTEQVKHFVEQNAVVPLLADYTDHSPDIKQAINELRSVSIPLLAIYPTDPDRPPIILRDLVSEQEVLDALQQAAAAESHP